MESRKLEIVLHSAKDLHDRKHFGTMDPYATVWLAGGGVVSEIHKTSVAKKAGSFPVWECPMEFDAVPLKKDYTLFCEIQHDGKLFDRKIGEVQVPFKDLLAGDGSRDKGSYPVKIQSGEVMGSIILSHKFTDLVVIPSKKDDLETTPSKDSSTSGAKNKTGSSEGKTSGNVKSSKKKKDKTPTKKVQGKKKQGMVKRIAKSVGTKVVAEAVLLAGTAAVFFALDDDLDAEEVEDEEVEVEGEDEDGDQNEDEVDDEDEDEDQNEDDDDDDDDDDAEEYF